MCVCVCVRVCVSVSMHPAAYMWCVRLCALEYESARMYVRKRKREGTRARELTGGIKGGKRERERKVRARERK